MLRDNRGHDPRVHGPDRDAASLLTSGGLWPSLAEGHPDNRVWTLLAGARHVELKVLLPPQHHRAVLSALDRAERSTRVRRVYYLDAADRSLATSGLIVRVRHQRHGIDDSTVKLRRPVPSEPVELPERVRRSRHLTVEFDALPGSLWWSAALKRRLAPTLLGSVVTGRRSPAALFSVEQHDLLLSRLPGLGLDELVVHGPVEVTRTPVSAAGLGQKTMLESWTYPDQTRLLELSTRCRRRRARVTADRIEGFLTALGITAVGHQPTKAHATLEHFACGH